MRSIIALAVSAVLVLAGVYALQSGPVPPASKPDTQRQASTVNLTPAAALLYQYMSFEGCRNALQGVNPDNHDNDLLTYAQRYNATWINWGSSSPDRRPDGSIDYWPLFIAHANGKDWSVHPRFRCVRTSSTNVDDWLVDSNYPS